MQPQRRSPLNTILSVLLVIALLALAWFAWQWVQQGDRADRLDREVTQLRQDAANVIVPSDDDDTTVADRDRDTTATNETEQILDAAKAYERAKSANRGTEQNYEIAKREGDFARVSVNYVGGTGHLQILKNVDGTWLTVLAGQQFSDEELQEFGVPASLVRD